MSNIPNTQENNNTENRNNISNNTPDIISRLKEQTINTPTLSLEGYYSVGKSSFSI